MLLWFARSHQLGSRYRDGQRHVRRSSISNQRGDACPIKSPSSLGLSSSVRRSGFRRLPTRRALTPKQQLCAILSLLLQDMEGGLGQFVGDDVVTDHLPTSSLMSFQLPF